MLMPPLPELFNRCLSRNHKISSAAFTCPCIVQDMLSRLPSLIYTDRPPAIFATESVIVSL